jgi:tricarballylate dehydrogenase
VGGGLAIVEALTAKAKELNVSFNFSTTAHELALNDEGQVVGLHVIRRSGQRSIIRGKAVILACGGFEGNPEMLTQYLGSKAMYLRPVARGGYYNKGEGIRMALGIGAAPSGEYGAFHAELIDPRSGVTEPSIFIFPYGILVNKDGERFTDEAPGSPDFIYERVTRRIFEQREGIAYLILDSRIDELPNWRKGARSDVPPIRAASLEDLAAEIGIPADRLVETVTNFNTACRPGQYDPLRLDGLAAAGIQPRKSNWAIPINSPPYLCYPVIAGNVFTFGGLKVNRNAQVLTNDGEPICGLYAAGETMGIYFGNYTGSTSVLRGAVFGHIAGKHAAN